MGGIRNSKSVAERRAAIIAFVRNNGGEAVAKDIYKSLVDRGYKINDLRHDLARLNNWTTPVLKNRTNPDSGTIKITDVIEFINKELKASMKNSEGYPDPTASKAINAVDWSKIDGNADVCPGDIWWLKSITKSGELLERYLVISTFDDGGTVGFSLKEYKSSDVGYMSTNCYKFKVVSQKANELIDVYVQLHRIKNVPSYILTKLPFDGWIQDEDLMKIRSYVLKAYNLLPKNDTVEVLTERIRILEEDNKTLNATVEKQLIEKSTLDKAHSELLEGFRNLESKYDEIAIECEEASNNYTVLNDMYKELEEKFNNKVVECENAKEDYEALDKMYKELIDKNRFECCETYEQCKIDNKKLSDEVNDINERLNHITNCLEAYYKSVRDDISGLDTRLYDVEVNPVLPLAHSESCGCDDGYESPLCNIDFRVSQLEEKIKECESIDKRVSQLEEHPVVIGESYGQSNRDFIDQLNDALNNSFSTRFLELGSRISKVEEFIEKIKKAESTKISEDPDKAFYQHLIESFIKDLVVYH